MRLLRLVLFSLSVLGIWLPTIRAAEEPPVGEASRPRVLILGDSISIGYTPIVKKMLADEAVVIRPTQPDGKPENCAGATNGVAQLDRWLQQDGGNWNVIHFNFGLHDLKRVDPATGAASSKPDHPRQAEPEKYEQLLRQIVARLKKTGAALVFATTTPVPPGGVRPHRDVEDPQRYNAIAKQIMEAEGLAINDLYTIAQPLLDQIQQPVNVHFTERGSELLAGEVARHVRKALAEIRSAAR